VRLESEFEKPLSYKGRFTAMDKNSDVLLPAIISAKVEGWMRKRQASLVSKTTSQVLLTNEDLAVESRKAFDLLDAITKSGETSHPIQHHTTHLSESPTYISLIC
jgi:hypothetical protein